jgi:hypothetical protein
VEEVVMDPVLAGWDLVVIVAACIACGMAGGIASDLTEPILRRKRNPAAGPAPADAEAGIGDNRLAVPRLIKPARGGRVWDAGFLGPLFVGAIAALIAVLLLAVNQPDSPATIERQALRTTLEAQQVPAAAITAVEGALKTRKPYVQWEKLIPIALIAGFAGVAVLRIARSRLLDALGKVAFDARTAGILEGGTISAEAAAKKAEDPAVDSVESQAKPVLTDAIKSAVEEHIDQLSRSSPYGNPEFA